MSTSSSYTHRIDPVLRAQSEALFGELAVFCDEDGLVVGVTKGGYVLPKSMRFMKSDVHMSMAIPWPTGG